MVLIDDYERPKKIRKKSLPCHGDALCSAFLNQTLALRKRNHSLNLAILLWLWGLWLGIIKREKKKNANNQTAIDSHRSCFLCEEAKGKSCRIFPPQKARF